MAGAGFAVWRGSPNHYDGRLGQSVNHITLHIMVGRLAGTDSCFQRSGFGAASHYGVGGDGTIYQWVDEDNGSWADANWRSDCSGVTIEHEGGMAGVPVTDAEVEASARLCADIARRYGWASLWHDASGNRAGNVVLHREVPGTDHYGCPDRCTNPLPVDRIINRANELLNGEDMPTAQEIAEAVWEYKYGNSPAGGNMFNLLSYELPHLIWEYNYKKSAFGGNMYNALNNAANNANAMKTQVATLQTQVTALTETVKTLAAANGADPDTIAKTVEAAVRDKLDKLQITITSNE
ncbi:MAG: N-acetylmuramoyl-L-alanine amidase [Bifidobacterium dentium]|nr:N-acetylmuramoyl-L-alanine amidase [Bifidobacterium dentium]